MVMTKTRAQMCDSLDVQNRDPAMKFAIGMLDAIHMAARDAGIESLDGFNLDTWRNEIEAHGLALLKPTFILTQIALTAKSEPFVADFLKVLKAAPRC